MTMPHDQVQFILKLSARCNLNCDYCYVFNRADQSWRSKPGTMSDEVFDAAIEMIRRHCLDTGQTRLRLMFHGGEPMLIGVRRFAELLGRAAVALAPVASLRFALQTNGVLIDRDWVSLFQDAPIDVGVSVDGPAALHDLHRVDHRGRGSYDRVKAGLDRLHSGDVPFNVLAVIPLGVDGAELDDHLCSLNPATINYLFPDQVHADMPAIWHAHGATPVADVLIPALDRWFERWPEPPEVPLFHSICRLVLGGSSRTDMFGNHPGGYLFIETDGAIEGLDVLRVAGEGIVDTGCSVFTDRVSDVASSSAFHRASLFDGFPLPTDCAGCHESTTCAGGYLPHRWSDTNGFDNPSAWCADILALFGHVRGALAVASDETDTRRVGLATLQEHVG